MRQATTHDQEAVSSISPLASDLTLHAKQSCACFEPPRAWFLSPQIYSNNATNTGVTTGNNKDGKHARETQTREKQWYGELTSRG